MQANMVNAINNALDLLRAENEGVVLLGEDIGVDGGVFRVTEGLLAKYGKRELLIHPSRNRPYSAHR